MSEKCGFERLTTLFPGCSLPLSCLGNSLKAQTARIHFFFFILMGFKQGFYFPEQVVWTCEENAKGMIGQKGTVISVESVYANGRVRPSVTKDGKIKPYLN